MTRIILVTLSLVATASLAAAQSPAPRPTTPMPLAVPAPPAPAAPMVFVEPPVPPAPVSEFAVEVPAFDFAVLDLSLRDLDASLADMKLGLLGGLAGLNAQLPQSPQFPQPPQRPQRPQLSMQSESLYDQARSLIERDQYERALPILDRVIDSKGTRADAAMYWKAYSLSKLTRRQEALTVLADLQKQFPNNPWLRDARALDVEIRQASGQSVSPDFADDETKILALRGLMQSDPDSALPTIERLLAGDSSVRVKDRALFLLSQSRATRAREVIVGVAKSGSNPELRLSAVRYLGMRPDPESQKILADIYGSTSDVDTKRAILRSLMTANARERLLAVAKTEKSPELRAVAVQQLGAVRGAAELEELYRTDSDRDVKQRILQSMIAANAADKLAQIARTERDPDLQRLAIRYLGATNKPEATESLRAIYGSDVPVDTKKAVIEALSIHQNCSALVTLAKSERNKELQTEIVRRLANVTNRCPEARNYMEELLK